MAAITVRNLPDETHRALKRRAAEHGRSTEAEIRAIPEDAVRPDSGDISLNVSRLRGRSPSMAAASNATPSA